MRVHAVFVSQVNHAGILAGQTRHFDPCRIAGRIVHDHDPNVGAARLKNCIQRFPQKRPSPDCREGDRDSRSRIWTHRSTDAPLVADYRPYAP